MPTDASTIPRPYALVAEFADVDGIIDAARKVRDAGYTHWDPTPLPRPRHGPRHGIRPPFFPGITLAHALVGLVGGLCYVWWTNATTIPVCPPSCRATSSSPAASPFQPARQPGPSSLKTTILLAAGHGAGHARPQSPALLHNPLLASTRFGAPPATAFSS